MAGQFRACWHAAELLCQVARRLADFQYQVLQRAVDMYLSAPVREVPLDFPDDVGPGVAGQAAAEGQIEVVDRLQQADIPTCIRSSAGSGPREY